MSSFSIVWLFAWWCWCRCGSLVFMSNLILMLSSLLMSLLHPLLTHLTRRLVRFNLFRWVPLGFLLKIGFLLSISLIPQMMIPMLNCLSCYDIRIVNLFPNLNWFLPSLMLLPLLLPLSLLSHLCLMLPMRLFILLIL